MFKKLLMINLVAVATISMATQASADETFKIAFAGPVTGSVAQYGDMNLTGISQAIDDINAAGGVLGKKVQVIKYDDACDPKQAVQVANKIVNDGIKYVVGHVCSGSTQPVGDIYNEEGILLISPAATAPELTTKGWTTFFRTIGLDDMQSPAAAKYVIEKIKPARVAVIHDKQQYGEGLATVFRDELTKAKVNVSLFEGITAGEKNFSALIDKMKKAKIDLVYYGGYYPEMGVIIRQSVESGFKPKFLGPEGIGNAGIIAIAGKASEGMLLTLPKSFDQVPANAKIVAAIKAKKQDPSGTFVFTAYSAVKVIGDAINKAKTFDTSKVAEVIHSSTFDTPMGKISFKPNGDLKNFEFALFEWHADGTKTELTQ